jgi:gas vesicle protein
MATSIKPFDPPSLQSRRSPASKLPLLGFGAAVGALVAFFLDPDRGRSRRALTRDQLAALMRRTGRRIGRTLRWSEGPVVGLAAQVITSPWHVEEPIDHEPLAHKVETAVKRSGERPLQTAGATTSVGSNR